MAGKDSFDSGANDLRVTGARQVSNRNNHEFEFEFEFDVDFEFDLDLQ